MIGDPPVRISLVVAAAENGVIGRDGTMPWRLPQDLKRFKAVTMGKPIIMGRKTFESIGRPLPGRDNIVLTSNRDFFAEAIDIKKSLEASLETALTKSRACDGDELCIIGGGEVYARALPLADRIYRTRVLGQPDGDTFFPDINQEDWVLSSSEELERHPKATHDAVFEIWDRRP